MNKVNELLVLVSQQDVQIVCVTETHLNSTVFDAEVSLPNFVLFREDREDGTKHGGSAIYVHSSLKAERLDWFNGLESIALTVKADHCEFIVICVYRSPSLTVAENSNLLKSLDNLPLNLENDLIVVGDINLPQVNWNSGVVKAPENTKNQILKLQQDFGLEWHF